MPNGDVTRPGTGGIKLKDGVISVVEFFKAAFSVMMFLPQIYEGFDLGYAYESPTSSRLSETGNKAHEIILRIKLGSRPDSKSGPQSNEQ